MILDSQGSETLGQGQSRQSQESVDPITARNTLTTGRTLLQLGKLVLRELSNVAGVQIGGDLLFSAYETGTDPTLGLNLGPELGPANGAVDPAMVKNFITTGQFLVKLGKQELRELSNLVGVQIGGDLLFSSYKTYQNPSYGVNRSSNLNSSLPSSNIVTQKSMPPPNTHGSLQPTQSSAPPTNTATNSGVNNNELVYQTDSLPLPQLLEIAATPQTSVAPSVTAPTYKGSYNPLAEDDFHVSFSVLNPNLGSKKTIDHLMYPIQFYSPEAHRVASLQNNPEEIPFTHQTQQTNYDNFDAW